jgi:membrane-anchored glycerophosphoryl diester phosphodiesterase (GDPDase)
MNKLFIILLSAAVANSEEKGKYFMGGLLVFFVMSFILQIPYSRLDKKIKNTKAEKTPFAVQNELDYAAYMQWAAMNGYEVYFNKRSVSRTDTHENEE